MEEQPSADDPASSVSFTSFCVTGTNSRIVPTNSKAIRSVARQPELRCIIQTITPFRPSLGYVAYRNPSSCLKMAQERKEFEIPLPDTAQ